MRDSPLGTVDPGDFQRIRDVFEAALARPAADRRAFVEQACGGDTRLVANVERMLAADEASGVALDRGAAHRGTDPGAPRACPACRTALSPSHRFCPSFSVLSLWAFRASLGGRVFRAPEFVRT